MKLRLALAAILLPAFLSPALANDEQKRASERLQQIACELSVDPQAAFSLAQKQLRAGRHDQALATLGEYRRNSGGQLSPDLVSRSSLIREDRNGGFVLDTTLEGPFHNMESIPGALIVSPPGNHIDVLDTRDLLRTFRITQSTSERPSTDHRSGYVRALRVREEEQIRHLYFPPNSSVPLHFPFLDNVNPANVYWVMGGQFLLAVPQDPEQPSQQVLRVYTLKGEEISERFGLSNRTIRHYSVSPDGSVITWTRTDGTAEAWKTSNLTQIFAVQPDVETSESFRMRILAAPQGKFYFLESYLERSKGVRLVRTLDSKGNFQDSSIESALGFELFSPDGEHFLMSHMWTAEGMTPASLRNAENKAIAQPRVAEAGHVSRSFSASGRELVLAHSSGKIDIIETHTGALLTSFMVELDREAPAIHHSPDGTYFLIEIPRRPMEFRNYQGKLLGTLLPSPKEPRMPYRPLLADNGNTLFLRTGWGSSAIQVYRWGPKR